MVWLSSYGLDESEYVICFVDLPSFDVGCVCAVALRTRERERQFREGETGESD